MWEMVVDTGEGEYLKYLVVAGQLLLESEDKAEGAEIELKDQMIGIRNELFLIMLAGHTEVEEIYLKDFAVNKDFVETMEVMDEGRFLTMSSK